MTDSLKVDTSSFSKFSKDLKRAEPELAKSLRKNMLAAGELVAVDARRRAVFSTRIPGAIKVGVSGNRIRVYANARKVPHARPLEHGGQPGSFRHPVFQTGDNPDTWVSQPARPFLHPALIAQAPLAVKAAKHAVDDTLNKIPSHR